MLAAMLAINGPKNAMVDFHAFYCAGSAIAHRANPYLEEPLHSCEQAARPPAMPTGFLHVTLPAPLLPAVLLAFAPFSYLPFVVAASLYGVLLLAAMAAAIVLFAGVIGVSTTIVNLAFAAIVATQMVSLGQPAPFVLLALACAAIAVRRARWIEASAFAYGTVIEPHLAAPILLATFAFLPRTRLPLVAFGLLCALLCVAAVGTATSISYVRDVLPAHALANAFEWQCSLTSILTSLGVDAPRAIRYGGIMYVGMCAIGIAAAYRMWRTTGDRAAIVLIPPAFAVFGGVHIHYAQMAIAFPAILWTYARFPRVRNLAATGIVFAMIPWNVFCASLMTGFVPILVGWFGRSTMGARRGLVVAGVGGVIAISVLMLALAGFGPGDVSFVPHVYPPTALAELSWGDFSRASLARQSLLMQWIRIPVLAGLAMGLLAIGRVAFGRTSAAEPVARSRPLAEWNPQI
jgi:hypothetical protein